MAAPELRLNVSLDLGFFRQQLQKLTVVAQSEFTPKLNVRFNPSTLDRELNNLQRSIKRREYSVKIQTNLEGEIDAANRLVKALGRVQQAATGAKGGLPVGTQALSKTKGQGGFSFAEIKTLFNAAIQGGLLDEKTLGKTRDQMVAGLGSIGKDAIAGLLNGLNSSNADIKQAAEAIGNTLIATTKKNLGIASPSKKFEEIGKNVGEGFEKGALSSMDNAFDALERKMRQRGKILDTVARGIFRMLGMDPAAMLQEARQKRLPPAINWQATTVPSSAPPIGPSSTGRALPGTFPSVPRLPAAYRGLPFGYDFSAVSGAGGGGGAGGALFPMERVLQELKQQLMVLRARAEILSFEEVNIAEDLKADLQRALYGFSMIAQSLSEAADIAKRARIEEKVNQLVSALEREIDTARARARISPVSVSDLTGQRPALAGTRHPLMLPPAGGTTPGGATRFNRATSFNVVSTGAYVGQPGFMRAPSVPSSMGGGGGAPPVPPRGGGGGGSFGGMQFNVPNLPGAGLIREIGTEFAFAAKQVLLFGTAYKALAFIQSFPAQVGEAVGALQSFRNTLNVISPTAQEAAASSEFILNIVDKYNVPLQSARDGFTKLYASMAPTGFSGNEIRDLFTGISQAAATFGMSSDKVDRVTYAFAQMASKGQVMSEELKGQLGDVLPGAMGIFAKAAGFEGEDAIQKFGKALEDGAFKGKPMRDLLKNVTIELKKEFGPGAEGAARTYQGVMTRMANSTKLLYESFEPVAINFLNSIVVPITGGLKTVTDGFKAFFTGQAAQTAGGSAFAKQLEGLRPTFEGIRSNITSLIPIFQNFGKILLAAGQVFLQIASNPFVGYLARVYLNVVALTTVVNILNLRALIPFIANLARSAYSVVAFGVQCTLAGKKAVFFDLMVRTLGTTLRTFFAATAVGIILVGIGLIAEAFMTAGARADAARQKMSQFADSVKQLGALGDVAGATAEKVGQQSLAARLQNAKTLLQQVKSEGKKLTKEQVQELKNLQLTSNLDFVEVGRGSEKGMFAPQGKLTNLMGTQAALQAEIDSAGRGYLETQTKIVQATKAVTAAQQVQKKQAEESKAAGATAIDLTGGEDGAAKKTNLESYHKLRDDLAKMHAQHLIELDNETFRHAKSLAEMEFEAKEAFADEYQARQIQEMKKLHNIEMQFLETIRKARAEVYEASMSTAPGNAGTMGGGGRMSIVDVGKALQKAGFTVKENPAFGGVTPGVHSPTGYHPTGEAIDVTDWRGGDWKGRTAALKRAMSGAGFAELLGPGDAGHETHVHLAVGSGGISQEMFNKALASITGGAGVPAPVKGSVARDTRAEVSTELKQKEALKIEQNALTEALKQYANVIQVNMSTIFPIDQLKLENQLMEQRNQLQLQGMPSEYIQFREEMVKTEYESLLAVENYRKELVSLNEELAQTKPTKDNATQIAFLKGRIQTLNDAIASAPRLLKDMTIAQLENTIASMKQADALKQIQAEIELIDSNVENATDGYKNFLKEVAMGGDPVEALKKFQQQLADQVLTIVFDYAFQPVEEFLKNSLKDMFGLPSEEKQRQEALAKLEAQLVEQRKIVTSTEQTAINTGQGSGVQPGTTGQSVSGLNAAMEGIGGVAFDTNAGVASMAGFDADVAYGDSGIFASIQESLGTTMGDMSSYFDASLVDLQATSEAWGTELTGNIPNFLKMATDQTNQQGGTFKESLGKAVGAIGVAAGSIMGIAAGISQIKEGGTSNVLGGIGSILMGIGGGISGFGSLFGLPGFANGGMVTSPTLGLVGEGKYNEAIVPLPDGRSIPVQMQGESIRDKMGGGATSATASPVLSMSFQSTTINGVEYVDRAQLEAAMAETRRMASREGAARGANLALDKLANSPSSRRRVGLR